MTIEIDTSKLPILEGALDLARFGLIPEGRYTNEDWLFGKIGFDEAIPLEMKDLVLDPQTSGGLLLFMPPEEAEAFVREMDKPYCRIIGRVADKAERDVFFR